MPSPGTDRSSASAKRILLESGTNELEILVFEVGGQRYGVNVAKVREVIMRADATPTPGQGPAVRGMTRLRGKVLMVIDLHTYLGVQPANPDPKTWRVIVTEFNGVAAAFDVETVDSIYRLSWNHILPAPEATDGNQAAATGIAEVGDELVMMLDFESIYDAVATDRKETKIVAAGASGVNRAGVTVWLAEDSAFIRGGIEAALDAAGYVHRRSFDNGKAAWAACAAAAGGGGLPDIIVSDIEMAQMDGLHFCKRVKENPGTAGVKFMFYSSLINEQTRHKTEQVGGDAQVNKPNLDQVVAQLDVWAAEKQSPAAAA